VYVWWWWWWWSQKGAHSSSRWSSIENALNQHQEWQDRNDDLKAATLCSLCQNVLVKVLFSNWKSFEVEKHLL
jgi:hypothetical protein